MMGATTGKSEERWELRYGRDGVSIEPAGSGCRSYDCCGGTECGFTAAEAQAEVVAYHQQQLDRLRGLTPEEFLRDQGYS